MSGIVLFIIKKIGPIAFFIISGIILIGSLGIGWSVLTGNWHSKEKYSYELGQAFVLGKQKQAFFVFKRLIVPVFHARCEPTDDGGPFNKYVLTEMVKNFKITLGIDLKKLDRNCIDIKDDGLIVLSLPSLPEIYGVDCLANEKGKDILWIMDGNSSTNQSELARTARLIALGKINPNWKDEIKDKAEVFFKLVLCRTYEIDSDKIKIKWPSEEAHVIPPGKYRAEIASVFIQKNDVINDWKNDDDMKIDAYNIFYKYNNKPENKFKSPFQKITLFKNCEYGFIDNENYSQHINDFIVTNNNSVINFRITIDGYFDNDTCGFMQTFLYKKGFCIVQKSVSGIINKTNEYDILMYNKSKTSFIRLNLKEAV